MLGPSRSTAHVRVLRHRDGGARERRDVVAVEEPMEIRLAWRVEGRGVTAPVAVTMRTPGDDFDLAAGFLFTEGLLHRPDQVTGITYCRSGDLQEYNVVEVRLREGETVDPDELTRNFYTTSSCGVCGKASLDAVEAKGCAPLPDGTLRIPSAVIPELPGRLRDTQEVFDRTGGLHAAGLYSLASLVYGTEGENGSVGEGPQGGSQARRADDPPGDGAAEPLVREDVGRHNAVDKVIGRSFLDRRLPLADRVLVVSGRASFEIVQKAVQAGIPALVAVGAPSSLAVDLARRFNVTLVGFARNGGYNAYTGEGRIEGA